MSQYVFDFLLRQIMLRNVLDIPDRIVIEIPNDCAVTHAAVPSIITIVMNRATSTSKPIIIMMGGGWQAR
ncbi:MAG: hypothetical protein B7Z73_11285 [Planctomycetia bacterium 21-64-5]|nr:MAG: hypothetical protein B7Z73_11285 [Planctomycetia bacterium 21-64-5]HQU45089.1 hypothetical protein [Pirellulales bacterium]